MALLEKQGRWKLMSSKTQNMRPAQRKHADKNHLFKDQSLKKCLV